MKSIITVLALAFLFSNAYAEGEKKKVCHEKNGKQVCKMVKVHKNLNQEATAVPVPTKKK